MPVLALHGWLDNAASFALLGPALAGRCHVVAPDLTGHGRSDHRSADATYNIYDDLPQIRALVRHLGWERFALVGHSRGAIISALYAACFPEQITHLALLDGMAPPPIEEDAFVEQLRSFVTDRERLLGRPNRVYATLEDAIAARAEQGLDGPAAALIAQRNLTPCEGGYTWTTDPRLRGGSAAKMTRAQIATLLASLPQRTLLLMAQQGLAATHPAQFHALASRLPGALVEEVPGGHHFHMQEGVDTLARRIMEFFDEGD